MKITPIGDYLFVRKCIRPEVKDGIYLCPASREENLNFAEIIAVGGGCKYFTTERIGETILCPELSNQMHRILGENFAVRERSIKVLATFD